MVSGPLPVVVIATSAALLLVLATKRPVRRSLRVPLVAAVITAVVAAAVIWFVSDVVGVFGLPVTLTTRSWAIGAFAAAAFSIALAFRAATWRKIVSIASVVAALLAGGIGINLDIGEFPTIGNALGMSKIQALRIPTGSAPPMTVETLHSTWTPPQNMPKTGVVGSVTIPGTVSHFSARQAIVYLPPAARVASPPKLPILEMLSGQPGAPTNVITSGQLPQLADAYAQAHGGLAPIVVIPDQLGDPGKNPMCVDSALGNSATYLTVDVPNWIHTHLNVLTGRQFWAIGGFSQGGTCSIQLGTKFTSLFGSILDIAGELAPHRGSIAATIKDAFAGSSALYTAATPLSLLAAGTPFSDTLGIFIAGQNDTKFGPAAATISTAATAAGMTVHYGISPGTAHDWHTVQFGLTAALPILGAKWGLQ